jgi:hypothetical protein
MDAVNSVRALAQDAVSLEQVRKEDLRCGDRVLIRTGNSSYTILVLADGLFWVWGGWFDRKGIAPQRVSINGCTWGGNALKRDVVAALGLRLEFGNRVLTTPIREVRVVRASWGASPARAKIAEVPLNHWQTG